MFAWDIPTTDKFIHIEFDFEDENYVSEIVTFDFDKMDSEDYAKRYEVFAKKNTGAQNYRLNIY